VPDRKIEIVRSVPLFSHCGKKELEAIARTADLIVVPEGMNLVTEGQHTNEFVVIAEGSADVTRDGEKLTSLGSGDFFGEIALVTGGPRTATVTSNEESTLLVLTDRAFWPLAEEMPSIQTAVMKALAERLHNDTL
jgi:CRP-like cAMP-binding protein